jgi:hypothetical protein
MIKRNMKLIVLWINVLIQNKLLKYFFFSLLKVLEGNLFYKQDMCSYKKRNFEFMLF